VLDFQEIDQTHVAVVGGKGALLEELSRIEGIRVPPGLCVGDSLTRIPGGARSTEAFFGYVHPNFLAEIV